MTIVGIVSVFDKIKPREALGSDPNASNIVST